MYGICPKKNKHTPINADNEAASFSALAGLLVLLVANVHSVWCSARMEIASQAEKEMERGNSQ